MSAEFVDSGLCPRLLHQVSPLGLGRVRTTLEIPAETAGSCVQIVSHLNGKYAHENPFTTGAPGPRDYAPIVAKLGDSAYRATPPPDK